MFEDFEKCVSNANISKNNAELTFSKCQDNTYAEGEKELPTKPPVEEKAPEKEVSNYSIEWKGDKDFEKTDLKKGDYVEVKLNFVYDGTRTGYKVKFQDIDKDCEALNLKIIGYKIFGKVPDNFSKCEVSVFAYAIKVPKIQSGPKKILFTSEKKKLPTLSLEIRGHGKPPKEIKMMNLKPGEFKSLLFTVKKAKFRKIKLEPELDKDEKCVPKGAGQKIWLEVSSDKSGKRKYFGGTRGFITGKVPTNFKSCEFSFKVTNLAGEFSDSFLFKLACPTCKEVQPLDEKAKAKFAKNLLTSPNIGRGVMRWKKWSDRNKKAPIEVFLSKVEQDLKKYIDHRTWRPDKISELVNEGASPNITNRFGNSILAMAVLKADEKLVTFLVERGADPHKKNKKGFSAMKFAERNKKIKAVLEEAIKGSLYKNKVLGSWELCHKNDKRVEHWHVLPNMSVAVENWQVNLSSGSKGCEGRKLTNKLKTFHGTYKVSPPPPGARVKDKEGIYFDVILEGGIKFYNLVKREEDQLIFSVNSRGELVSNPDYRPKQFLNKLIFKTIR